MINPAWGPFLFDTSAESWLARTSRSPELDWIREYLSHIGQPGRRALVERFLALFETQALPVLPTLRTSIIQFQSAG